MSSVLQTELAALQLNNYVTRMFSLILGRALSMRALLH